MAALAHSLRRSPSLCARSASLERSAPSRRAFSASADVPAPEQLAGTVSFHRCFIFLHDHQPPSTYPAKYTTPVQRRLLLATAPWGGAVNFAWSTSQPIHLHTSVGSDAQTYFLTAFSSTRGKLEIEAVSLANVEDVGRALRAHAEPRASEVPLPTSSPAGDIHLYVCTHGARDCRCGNTGGAVASAIRAELDRRQWCNASDPSTRITLAEVAHVGGHKYAANVLVYPHGEWLGRVRPENVPEMMDAILARLVRPMRAEETPICPSHWRGRTGLGKDEQIKLFSQFVSDQNNY